MTLPTPGQTFEVTAERLAFGGFAIARHDGIAIFIPFAAPGDRLQIEIVAVEKKFVRAKILSILAPGPGRIEPRCVHYQECGGCQFQHIDYATQVAAKADFLRDALQRTGGFDWPQPVVVHHAEPWAYRVRTQLKLQANSGLRSDADQAKLPKKQRKASLAAETAIATDADTNQRPRLGFHRAFTNDVIDVQHDTHFAASADVPAAPDFSAPTSGLSAT